jgi:hypothetical protein
MAPRVYRNLDEIFAGEYEGMTYQDIKATFPDEAQMRSMDKIGYRYPRGESYLDLLSRLDPLVRPGRGGFSICEVASHFPAAALSPPPTRGRSASPLDTPLIAGGQASYSPCSCRCRLCRR